MPIRKEGFHGDIAGEAGTTRGTSTGATGAAMDEYAREYGRRTADAASSAKDYVSDKVSLVGDKLRDLQAMDYAQMVEQTKDHMRQKPGQTLLISAAAGFVIGLLLRGRRRRK